MNQRIINKLCATVGGLEGFLMHLRGTIKDECQRLRIEKVLSETEYSMDEVYQLIRKQAEQSKESNADHTTNTQSQELRQEASQGI